MKWTNELDLAESVQQEKLKCAQSSHEGLCISWYHQQSELDVLEL